jgi:hypothetical protein
MLPEPAILAFKVSESKSYAFILPDPAIEHLRLFVVPFNFMFPEPPIEAFKVLVLIFAVILPDPPMLIDTSSDLITFCTLTSPEPPKETASILSKGIVTIKGLVVLILMFSLN